MAEQLKIMLAISEVEGLVKTGGLADFGRALPLVLKERGHDVRIILPYFRSFLESVTVFPLAEAVAVQMGTREICCSVWQGFLQVEASSSHTSKVPIYFIEHDFYFDRDHLYDDGTIPFADNAQRFGFFSKAVLRICQLLDFSVDIFHCNDWHTALIPFYLKEHEADNPFFQRSATLLTLHNASFQGHFPSAVCEFLGIGRRHFDPMFFEDHGQINLLKGGVAWADKINAVSPGYARELLTPLGGHGLHQSFLNRREDLIGILNGCDYRRWNPASDPLIPANYDAKDLRGKAICKKELQQFLRLPDAPHIAIISMVTRVTEQKGFSYLLDTLEDILNWKVQLIILGIGESWIEEALHDIATRFPANMRWCNQFDEQMSHWIEAGSDMFLMPSLFEPCGLNQMYSLRYGTLPIVRATGGLQDSVRHYSEKEGTGFLFYDPSSQALTDCVKEALTLYEKQPRHFQKLIQNAIAQCFDWHRVVQQYELLYLHALQKLDS